MNDDMKLSNRNKKWLNNIFGNTFTSDFDTISNEEVMIRNMLNRTLTMFEYENLPKTVPFRDLEIILQTSGSGYFVKVNDEYYITRGNYGGLLNAYYRPKTVNISNPYIPLNATLEIDVECVKINNDTMEVGLFRTITPYTYLLSENLTTLKMMIINKRIPNILTASDSRTKESALEFFKDIEDGKNSIITGEDLFNDNPVNTLPFHSANSRNLTELIELHQYLKANLYNELGLQSNFNMKRESLNENEIGANEDTLIPLVDDMLKNRQDAIDKINTLYNLNIKVKLADVWDNNRIEKDNIINEDEEIETLESGGEDEEDIE